MIASEGRQRAGIMIVKARNTGVAGSQRVTFRKVREMWANVFSFLRIVIDLKVTWSIAWVLSY